MMVDPLTPEASYPSLVESGCSAGGVSCVLASSDQALIAEEQRFELRCLKPQVCLHPYLGGHSGELAQLSRNDLLSARGRSAPASKAVAYGPAA